MNGLTESQKNSIIEKAIKDQQRRRIYNQQRWVKISSDPDLKKAMYDTQKKYRTNKQIKITQLEQEIANLKKQLKTKS